MPERESDELQEWADELARDRDIRRRDARISELRRQVRGLHRELDRSEARLDMALGINEPKAPKPIQARLRRANEATAFLVASDWHVGEYVDPATVNGKNKYTPDIASTRAVRFFQNAHRLIELARAGARVDNAVLFLGGDMVTGYIHEELVESNTMSPTEEALFCQGLLAQGIDYLLDKAGISRLVVPCCYGNHGRLTPKRRISTGAKNSIEWMMYHILAQRYASDKRVEFVIANGAHLYLDAYGRTVRFTHGDDVRYGGGVGGLGIPLRKATDSWDTFRDADLTVIGHWHQYTDFQYAIVNGSLIGFNAYALSVKARYEPARQAFFLMDKDRGKTLVAPIWVED